MTISWTTDFEKLRAFYCTQTRGNNNNPVTHVRETRSWNKYDSGSRLSTRWPTLTARTRTTILVSMVLRRQGWRRAEWCCSKLTTKWKNSACPFITLINSIFWVLEHETFHWPKWYTIIYYDTKNYIMSKKFQNYPVFGYILWREDPTC